MKSMSHACLIAVLASACADAAAALDRRCVTSLEAQAPDAARKPMLAPKRPCPVAVAYARRNRATVGVATSPAPGNARV